MVPELPRLFLLSAIRLELDLRRLLELAARLAEVEELLAAEAERAREQRGRHLLDAGVVFLHRVVEEAARGGELVLDVGELGLQLLEVGVGLEVRIGLDSASRPRSALVSWPSAAATCAGPCAEIAALRAFTTSSRVPRSCAA